MPVVSHPVAGRAAKKSSRRARGARGAPSILDRPGAGGGRGPAGGRPRPSGPEGRGLWWGGGLCGDRAGRGEGGADPEVSERSCGSIALGRCTTFGGGVKSQKV